MPEGSGRHKSNAASRAFAELLKNAATNIVRMDQQLERWADEDWQLTGMSIKSPLRDDTGEWLVTVRAYVDGKACVAFHAAPGLLEALNGVAVRWSNKSLKWREDEYAR